MIGVKSVELAKLADAVANLRHDDYDWNKAMALVENIYNAGRKAGMREAAEDKMRLDYLQVRYDDDLKRNPDAPFQIITIPLDANYASIRNAIDTQIPARRSLGITEINKIVKKQKQERKTK